MMIKMSIVMVIMVVMIIVVLNNMVLWCMMGINVGIVVFYSVWVIEIVVSMMSAIGDNMMGIWVNCIVVHWLVMNCNWSMDWCMNWSMDFSVMWGSMSNCMSWNSSMMRSVMVWGWVSNNMSSGVNIMGWSMSGVNWGMSIMSSSEMGVDSIGVLVVCSMSTVVLWV